MAGRTARCHQQCGRSHLECLVGHGRGSVEVAEGHVAGGQQARVGRAELDHAAVVSPSDTVSQLRIALVFPVVQPPIVKRVEDQLTREAEQIEGTRPVLGQERTRCREVLALHDLDFFDGAVLVGPMLVGYAVEGRVQVSELFVGITRLPQLVPARVLQWLDPFPHAGIGVISEPRRCLHDVCIGVVHDATTHVRHRTPCSSVGAVSRVDLPQTVPPGSSVTYGTDGASPAARSGPARERTMSPRPRRPAGNTQGGSDMDETMQAQGWWLASDGNWYPPEQHPDAQSIAAAGTPATASTPTALPTRAAQSGLSKGSVVLIGLVLVLVLGVAAVGGVHFFAGGSSGSHLSSAFKSSIVSGCVNDGSGDQKSCQSAADEIEKSGLTESELMAFGAASNPAAAVQTKAAPKVVAAVEKCLPMNSSGSSGSSDPSDWGF